jgi:hypothetical protein
VPPGSNPYEFITNPGTPKKQGLFSGGPKKQRILVVAVLGLVLLMVGIIVAAVISSSGNGNKQDYLALLQQQSELIRVSEIGEKTAHDSKARNLALTAKLSLTSTQGTLTSLAKKAGAQTDAKSIALGKDSSIDTKLADAEQTNSFDDEFIKTIQDLLDKYSQTLKKLYDEATSSSAKSTLQQAYNNAQQLISDNRTEETQN